LDLIEGKKLEEKKKVKERERYQWWEWW